VRHVVDLWHRQQRAKEEQNLCVNEMANVYTYYHRMHTALVEAVESERDIGKRAVLFKLGALVERRCMDLHSSFLRMEAKELQEVEILFNLQSPEEDRPNSDENAVDQDIVELLDADLGAAEFYDDIDNIGPDSDTDDGTVAINMD